MTTPTSPGHSNRQEPGAFGRNVSEVAARSRQLDLVEAVALDVCPGGQRKDALADQLRDVRRMATAMGCYDAAGWIESHASLAGEPHCTRHEAYLATCLYCKTAAFDYRRAGGR